MTPWSLDDLARKRLRHSGYTVLPPQVAPEPSTVWRPTRTTSLPRMVFSVGEHVAYADVWVSDDELGRLPVCATDVCALATWHRWRRRTRAVRS